jgi:1-acyl-sn-glycerol-3-phosphate acyltransferase
MTINKTDLPEIPDCVPTKERKLTQFIGLLVLNLLGWQVVGQLPRKSKFIAAVAPHTSNWDFVIGIATVLAMNLRISFMGKKAIFVWPFKILLKNLGGIAIDRNAKHGMVDQMVEQFLQNEQLVLGIAPEGTRKKTLKWKSGFLHIAHQAGVPVVPVSLDFVKKQLRFHPEVEITKDIENELAKFKDTFSDICAKNPQAA